MQVLSYEYMYGINKRDVVEDLGIFFINFRFTYQVIYSKICQLYMQYMYISRKYKNLFVQD